MVDIRNYKGEKNWKYTELSEESGLEARAYFLWFEKQVEKRIKYLREYLAENKASCMLDYSEESLSNLWIWYRGCRNLAREKINENKEIEKELFGILAAIEMDIAIYFAETLIHNHPQLYWDYVKKGTKLYAYHQPVVMGFDNSSSFFLLPWQIIETCAVGEDCYGDDNNIRDVYKVWEGHIKPLKKI